MKKLILLFACTATLLVAGCKDGETNNIASLEGTTWEATIPGEEGQEADVATLKFTSNTFEAVTRSGNTSNRIEGRYTYADSIVTLINGQDTTETLVGTVTSDRITFDNEGDITIFIRK